MQLLHLTAEIAAKWHSLTRGNNRIAEVGAKRVVTLIVAKRIEHRPAIALGDGGEEPDGPAAVDRGDQPGDVTDRNEVTWSKADGNTLCLESRGDPRRLRIEELAPVLLLLPSLGRLRPPGVAPQQVFEAECRFRPVASVGGEGRPARALHGPALVVRCRA